MKGFVEIVIDREANTAEIIECQARTHTVMQGSETSKFDIPPVRKEAGLYAKLTDGVSLCQARLELASNSFPLEWARYVDPQLRIPLTNCTGSVICLD